MMVTHSNFAEEIDMDTTVVVADWIKRLADDERMRDAVRLQEEETTARQANLNHRNGQRLMGELRAAITRDVKAFREEFPRDDARAVVVEAAGPGGEFVVRKPARPGVSLTVTPNLNAAAMVCHFRFMLADGLPPREDRFEVMFAGESGDSLLMRHHHTGQVFATADGLSEFLLVPVLTGRPR
jgi:hypothetical protein